MYSQTIENEIARLKKIIADKEKENIPLRKLFEDGMGDLKFVKTHTNLSGYTSNYNKECEENFGEFTILENIMNFIDIDKLNSKVSIFLNEIKSSYGSVHFASEQALQVFVRDYLKDVLAGSKLQFEVIIGGSIRGKDESTNKENSITLDIWIIISNDYRPILVIEVKSPLTTGSTSNKETPTIFNPYVVDQLYNYIKRQHNFSGQKFIFGIITTLDEWRIFWLPETNECAKSEVYNIYDYISDEDVFEFNNIIYGSKVYKHNDPDLTKIILSVIIKSYKSPVYPIDLLSTHRNYIKLTKTTYHWIKFKESEINKIKEKISFKIPHKNTSVFNVLRYFNGGNYSRVRLVISDNGNIVVLKNFLESVPENKIENELICWKIINNQNVYKTTIVGGQSLVMPFVYHAIEDQINTRIIFCLNFRHWSVQDKAIPGELPRILEIINLNIFDFLRNFHKTIRQIAEEAIEKCANKKYVHNDLQFRHIGLLPIIDEDLNIIDLESVFIDFEHTYQVDSVEEARDIMLRKLNNLFERYKEYLIEEPSMDF